MYDEQLVDVCDQSQSWDPVSLMVIRVMQLTVFIQDSSFSGHRIVSAVWSCHKKQSYAAFVESYLTHQSQRPSVAQQEVRETSDLSEAFQIYSQVY